MYEIVTVVGEHVRVDNGLAGDFVATEAGTYITLNREAAMPVSVETKFYNES